MTAYNILTSLFLAMSFGFLTTVILITLFLINSKKRKL